MWRKQNQWPCQPKMFGSTKYFDFKRGTVFGLIQHVSQHKMKRYARSLEEDHGSPGYAHEQNPVGWFLESLEQFSKPRVLIVTWQTLWKLHDFFLQIKWLITFSGRDHLCVANPALVHEWITSTVGNMAELAKILSHHHWGLLKYFREHRRIFQQLSDCWAICKLILLEKQTCWISRNFYLIKNKNNLSKKCEDSQ